MRFLEKSPHRLSLKDVVKKIEIEDNEIKLAIRSLIYKGYIRQDSRDGVRWDHEKATFYTEPSKREKIDRLIK